MPLFQFEPVSSPPEPTPTVFHPRDAAQLYLRGQLTEAPNTSPGRWQDVSMSELPEDDAITGIMRNLNRMWSASGDGAEMTQLRFPALLHSPETLVYLGFDANFARSCWNGWAKQNPSQRKTFQTHHNIHVRRPPGLVVDPEPAPRAAERPAFLSNAIAHMLNQHLRAAWAPMTDAEITSIVYEMDPSLSSNVEDVLEAHHRAYEAHRRRVFGLSTEASWFVFHAVRIPEVTQALGLDGKGYVAAPACMAPFPQLAMREIDPYLLVDVLLEPRFQCLLHVKRVSEWRASLLAQLPPWPSRTSSPADSNTSGESSAEQEVNQDVSSLLAALPRRVDPLEADTSVSASSSPASNDNDNENENNDDNDNGNGNDNRNDGGKPSMDAAARHDARIKAVVAAMRRELDAAFAAGDDAAVNAMLALPRVARYDVIPQRWLPDDIVSFITKQRFRKERTDVSSPKSEPKVQNPYAFLREVCWEGIPLGTVWDTAHDA